MKLSEIVQPTSQRLYVSYYEVVGNLNQNSQPYSCEISHFSIGARYTTLVCCCAHKKYMPGTIPKGGEYVPQAALHFFRAAVPWCTYRKTHVRLHTPSENFPSRFRRNPGEHTRKGRWLWKHVVGALPPVEKIQLETPPRGCGILSHG